MKTAALLVLSALSAGCALPSAEVDSAGSAQRGSAPSTAPTPSAPAPAAPEASTIYSVRRPGSLVRPDAHVVIEGANLQITAIGSTRLWVQEAADSGACELGAEIVAYRAIAVTLAARSDVPLAVGQHVTVEGTVKDVDGHRSIADGVVHVLDAPAAPFEAHCERDGAALAGEALDGVLVLTAGSSSGAPAITACFGDAAPVAVGAEMYSYDAWTESYYAVRGIVTRDGVLPRSSDDVVRRGNDACL